MKASETTGKSNSIKIYKCIDRYVVNVGDRFDWSFLKNFFHYLTFNFVSTTGYRSVQTVTLNFYFEFKKIIANCHITLKLIND